MQDEEEEDEEENSTIVDTDFDPHNFVIIQEEASASSDNCNGSNNFVIKEEEVGTAIAGMCSDPSNFVLVKEEIVDSANDPIVNAGEGSGQLYSELVIKEEDTSGKSVKV